MLLQPATIQTLPSQNLTSHAIPTPISPFAVARTGLACPTNYAHCFRTHTTQGQLALLRAHLVPIAHGSHLNAQTFAIVSTANEFQSTLQC